MNKILFICLLILLFSCDGVKPFKTTIQRQNAADLKKGYSSLLEDLNKMINPIGILPNECFFSHQNISKKSSFDYYEFFVAGRDTTIIILSANPMYYLKINSGEFYFHLKNERDQIDAGIAPNDKQINTIPIYKNVGDLQIEVYFTPTELKYVSSGSNVNRIGDNNAITDVDVYKLYQAANTINAFIPQVQEEQILQDFSSLMNSGKSVNLFTDSSTKQPAIYFTNPNISLPFSFISGENLSLTDDLLGTENIVFADIEKITRDFIFLLSVPLGNSHDSSINYLRDSSSAKHGIGVVIRGDISRFKEMIAYEGYNFHNSALNMTISENGSDPVDITLKWTQSIQVKIERKKTVDGSGAYVQIDTVTSNQYIDSGLEKGYIYYYRLKDISDNVLREGYIRIPKKPETGDLIFTEICWMGVEDSYDEWFEFKNNSNCILDLSDLKFFLNSDLKIDGEIESYLYPNEYFVIARSDEKFFGVYNCSNLFIDGFGNLSNSSITNLKLENSLGVEICSANSDPSFGDSSPKKTQVLSSDGTTWKTSVFNSTGYTDYGAFAGVFWGTPGFKSPANDEY